MDPEKSPGGNLNWLSWTSLCGFQFWLDICGCMGSCSKAVSCLPGNHMLSACWVTVGDGENRMLWTCQLIRWLQRVCCPSLVSILLLGLLRLQPLNEVHLFYLHFVYIDLINHALEEFTNQWNNHPVRTETNFSSQQLWAWGMISLCNSHHTAVQTVLERSPDYSN